MTLLGTISSSGLAIANRIGGGDHGGTLDSRVVPGLQKGSRLSQSPISAELATHLRAMAAGNHAALASCYDLMGPVVFSLAVRMLRDRPAAEDVTQDIFIQIWRQAANFDTGRGSPQSWVMMIARTRILDRLRSRSAGIILKPIGDHLPDAPDADDWPDDLAITHEDAVNVRTALATLPAEQKQVLDLAFFDGLTHVDIATKLGVPLGTVKTRIRLGLLKIKEKFAMLRTLPIRHGIRRKIMDASKDIPADDAFLDDAAVNAIGACTVEESAQFNAALATAEPSQRKTAADIQDAAARLAAASPYMEPSDKLRAAILAATAPTTFKMQDYRRVADVRSSRYLRWGMVAAAACLVWSGYSIMSLQRSNAQLVGTLNQQNAQIKQLAEQLDGEHTALSALVNPDVRQINLRSNTDHKIIGKMLVDTRTNQVMVVLPDAVIPPNSSVKMSIEQNGNKTEITALAVGGSSGSALVHWQTPKAIDVNKPIDISVNDGPHLAGFNVGP